MDKNRKTDFKIRLILRDATGKDIGIPSFDWEAEVYTSSRLNAVHASCFSGVYSNAMADVLDGHVLLILDNHRLSPGKVKIALNAFFPDDSFPDGSRRESVVINTDIVISTDSGNDCCASGSVSIPAGSVSAMLALVDDIAGGKKQIADALVAQGCDVSPDMSMATLANNILGLKVAQPDDVSAVSPTMNGRINDYDLLTVLYNNQRADFPYCCAVLFPARYEPIELRDADAFLCSDGFFTTESGTMHAIHEDLCDVSYVVYYFRNIDYTVPLYITAAYKLVALNGHPKFHMPSGFLSVKSYSQDLYDVTSEDLTFNNAVLMNLAGVRSFTIRNSFSSIGNIALRMIDFPDLEELHLNSDSHFINISTYYTLYSITLPKLNTIRNALSASSDVIRACPVLSVVSMPKLESIYSPNNGVYVLRELGALKKLNMPSLKELKGIIVYNCAQLTDISLPALQTISGGSVASSCAQLTDISLPALQTISGGSVASSCAQLTDISLPALKTFTYATGTGAGCAAGATLTVNMPDCEYLVCHANGTFNPTGSMKRLVLNLPKCSHISGNLVDSMNENLEGVIINLGAIVGGLFAISNWRASKVVEINNQPGFRSPFSIPNNATYSYLTVESLERFLDNLADNNDSPTITIQLGSQNLKKLTNEVKAAATAKNYSLS